MTSKYLKLFNSCFPIFTSFNNKINIQNNVKNIFRKKESVNPFYSMGQYIYKDLTHIINKDIMDDLTNRHAYTYISMGYAPEIMLKAIERSISIQTNVETLELFFMINFSSLHNLFLKVIYLFLSFKFLNIDKSVCIHSILSEEVIRDIYKFDYSFNVENNNKNNIILLDLALSYVKKERSEINEYLASLIDNNFKNSQNNKMFNCLGAINSMVKMENNFGSPMEIKILEEKINLYIDEEEIDIVIKLSEYVKEMKYTMEGEEFYDGFEENKRIAEFVCCMKDKNIESKSRFEERDKVVKIVWKVLIEYELNIKIQGGKGELKDNDCFKEEVEKCYYIDEEIDGMEKMVEKYEEFIRWMCE